MNEEAVKYAFDLFVRDGYKGDMDKFQKLLASNQEALDYSFTLFERDGYKGGKDKYKVLMGLGETATPISTDKSTKNESTTTEPVKELRSEPMATVKPTTLPESKIAEPTVDMTKMPVAEVKAVEAKPEPQKEIATETIKSDIESQLLPVTEKTEVKAVETPSDKMVIKSEPKVEETKVEPVEVAKMEVKEVKTEVEPKNEIPSYDDLGINTEKDPGALFNAPFDKNIKYEKMSPSELIDKDIFKYSGSNIKLERNKSLRYPDPPGTVFKKEKVGDREIYSSYDEKNKKWYIYDENSNKDNWTEVTAGPVKTLLNSKFIQEGNKAIQSKVDYNSDEEDYKIRKLKEGILLNKYLPYVMKNWDNLSETQKEKVKKDLRRYDDLMPKYLKPSDPNIDFWMDVNNKLFNNKTTAGMKGLGYELIQLDEIDEGDVKYLRRKYDDIFINASKLNSDIKGGNIKVLKSTEGDVLYNNEKDIFYYGPSEKEINESKEKLRLTIIPKGTFAYDKIKNSLEKYNK